MMPDTKQFGCQCDGLNHDGQRCKRKNNQFFPAVVGGGLGKSGVPYYIYGRPVRLCPKHWTLYCKALRNKERLPLINGGFLGPYNKYGMGNLVSDKPVIDWDNEYPDIPLYWMSEA